jgi:hypothetical protein
MKLKMADAVDIKVELVDISTDVETIIDKLTESALTIITALTVAHVVKSIFNKF